MIPNLLVRPVNHHPEIWFEYDDDGKNLSSMKCSIYTTYEKDIDHFQGFTREWITGSSNFRVSNAVAHANSKRPPLRLKNIRWHWSLHLPQVMKLLTSVPRRSSKYQYILDLEEIHGIDVGTSYQNDNACAEFLGLMVLMSTRGIKKVQLLCFMKKCLGWFSTGVYPIDLKWHWKMPSRKPCSMSLTKC